MRYVFNRIFFVALICGTLTLAGCQSSTERVNAFLLLCKFGQVNEIETAFKKSEKIDLAGEDGITGLMVAAAQGRTDVVKILLAAGADVRKQTSKGTTPLMFAVGRGSSIELVNALLVAGGDVNAKNIAGNTPLMLAAGDAQGIAEDYAVIFDLKEKQDGDQKENSGKTLAQAFVGEASRQRVADGSSQLMFEDDAMKASPGINKKNDAELLSLLLEKGADVNAKNVKGETAFMMAASRDKISIAGSTKAEHQAPASGLSLLYKAKADVNAQNSEGTTALMMATTNGNPAVLPAVIATGANVNAQDAEGLTALMLVAVLPESNVPALNALLKAGANIHARDKNGDTALILAAMRGNLSVVQAFLKAGSRLADKNEQGVSALGMSHEGDTRTFLIKAGADTKEQARWMAQRDLNACIKKTQEDISMLRFGKSIGAPTPYVSPLHECKGIGTLWSGSSLREDEPINLIKEPVTVDYYSVKLHCSVVDNKASCPE